MRCAHPCQWCGRPVTRKPDGWRSPGGRYTCTEPPRRGTGRLGRRWSMMSPSHVWCPDAVNEGIRRRNGSKARARLTGSVARVVRPHETGVGSWFSAMGWSFQIDEIVEAGRSIRRSCRAVQRGCPVIALAVDAVFLDLVADDPIGRLEQGGRFHAVATRRLDRVLDEVLLIGLDRVAE